MKIRSWRSLCVLLLSGCGIFAVISGCGKSYFFAGRNLPPSGILNRVMVAIQNPSAAVQGGELEIEDAYYDIRYNYKNTRTTYFMSGFTGSDPQTIQNMPAEQFGAVYSGDNSFALVSYAQEKQLTTVTGLPGVSTSIFATSDQRYIFAANPVQRVVTVIDRTLGGNFYLNLPNASRISVNPGGSVALVFVQDSNLIYSIFRLQAGQAAPPNAQDCEPQNLPVYCLLPVKGTFDRPIKAVFSPDGSTAYVLNCGPECGGSQASVSYLPTAGILIQSGTYVPPGSNTQVTATIPVPGGATDALANGSTLYLAGQQKQSDGYLAGELSVLDTATQQITGTYSISDGMHTKMVMGDDNSLWIGSQLCSQGERFQQNQNGANVPFGCVTLFNTSTNSVTSIDAYKGDATGLAAIIGLGKVYTTEGGQVYIYSTKDGSAYDNSNVTVVGTASDVAYIDAPSDVDNTNY